MIKPNEIESMGFRMAEVYGAVTDQLLINIARHFKRMQDTGKINGSFEWSVKKLAELGQVTAESVKIITGMLADADEELRYLLEESIRASLADVDDEMRKAAERGLVSIIDPPKLAPNQTQAFKTYYQQSADKLNLVNTVMLESTQQAYSTTVADIAARISRTQGILNAATGEVVTGATAYNQAIKTGIQRMVSNGLTGFIDHAGRHWSPEAYVAMDVRSTVANTARAALWERNNDFGNDLYIVSWHNGARPLCFPWQSKVISRTDNARDVTDLDGNTVHVYAQSETTYGEAAGLFGVNCKHLPLPFIPGLSRVDLPIQDEKENEKAYQLSQEQRALERKLRYEKRDLEILKASGAPAEEIKAQAARVREASATINQFCDENNLPRRRNRERAAVNATFPPRDSYDANIFDTTQRDQMREFFRGDRGTAMPSGAPPVFPTNTPPASSPVPVSPTTPQTLPMIYGAALEPKPSYTKSTAKLFEGAKAVLNKAPEAVKKVWSKFAVKLKQGDYGNIKEGAYYSPSWNKTYFQSFKKAFKESDYQEDNVVFFHEYGHNIDNMVARAKGMQQGDFFSYKYKDNIFGKTLLKECEENITEFYLKSNGFKDVYEAVKAKQNGMGGMGIGMFVRQGLRYYMPPEEYRAQRHSILNSGDDDAVLRPLFEKYLGDLADKEMKSLIHSKETGKSFCKYMKDNYTVYERGDISDMFNLYTVKTYRINYPFGVGHKEDYWKSEANLPIEAFAEMYSATVTNNQSLKVIKEVFPESYKVFEEILGEMAND